MRPGGLAALLVARRALGARVLFRCGAEVWRYDAAPEIAALAAGRLAAAGVGPGDRVAIMAGNSAAFLESVLGCAWLGAIAVPINTAARGAGLAHMLALTQPALCLADAEGAAHLPGARPIDGLPAAEAVAAHPSGAGDTLAILFTSGTTGPSKGVCCPHAQLIWWEINTGRMLELGERDVLATTLPLFHVNALNTFVQALWHGAEMVLCPRFSASGFWPTMAAAGATVIYVLGAMVPILLAQPAGATERAHRVRVALAPGVPAAMLATFTARTGVAVVDGYGATETNFVIGTTAGQRRAGWMGRVADGFTARVVDGEDNPVADGTPGELVLRADAPFAFATGYWGMAEQTVAAWRNLWFHTGDRVVRDGEGWLRFVDRIKEAIRRRGENISAWEVEQVLLAHPAIAGAAVYPVPSELAEDEVMAALVLRAPVTPEAVIAFCAPRLAAYALPRFIEIVDALPLTENGKLRKAELIARGVGPATWDRALGEVKSAAASH